MKLPRWIVWLILAVAVIVGSYYTVVSLRRAAAPPEPARTPSLDTAPVRVYGRVEPLHREVFLGPLQPRRVTKILVTEGMEVQPGQVLVELDSDVEQQATHVASLRVLELESQLDRLLDELRREAPLTEIRPGEVQNALQVLVLRVRELESRLDLVLDELKRKEPLSQIGAVSEQDFSQKILEAKSIRSQIATAVAEAELDFQQKQLQAESIRRQIATAKAEVELKRRELNKLTLVSPIEGLVYKLDVRIGELLAAQDYTRIVLGEKRKQVRMYVESYWFGKIRKGDRFLIRDGETLERIGEGTVTEVSPYVGVRDFRTEDSLERLDTKYGQAIVGLDHHMDLPLGQLVLCERKLATK
jgi:multidrug resistance efflux pump